MGKSSFEHDKNIFVGNINLDSLPLAELKKLPGLVKRILHKRIDKFSPDPKRVITRFINVKDKQYLNDVFGRVLGMSEAAAVKKLGEIRQEFAARHKDIDQILRQNFARAARAAGADLSQASKTKQLLIGALFTFEYSNESTSLFNPSVVIYPKQNDLKKGQVRVIFSFRATGEGHISSIVFRSAIIDKNSDIYLEPISRFASTPRINMDPTYDKKCFMTKLKEIDALNPAALALTNDLPDNFTYSQLIEQIDRALASASAESPPRLASSAETVQWLADSNYDVTFPPDQFISERVIFPVAPVESNGIEDARFVRFTDDDGSQTYYATYTAYNGKDVLPQLLETKDFHHFKMATLNGPGARNKGLALFPRKIGGRYVMISRIDSENLYLMDSDNIYFWYNPKKFMEPAASWEFLKIGNCGSPIETKKGWLLLTHGVGPMRKYCIGAALLDLKDPSKVIARLPEPLISPTEEEREGYVPNVVYSCGAIIINNQLIIPYASSDSVSSIAVISVDELLAKLLKNK